MDEVTVKAAAVEMEGVFCVDHPQRVVDSIAPLSDGSYEVRWSEDWTDMNLETGEDTLVRNTGRYRMQADDLLLKRS